MDNYNIQKCIQNIKYHEHKITIQKNILNKLLKYDIEDNNKEEKHIEYRDNFNIKEIIYSSK